MNTAYLLGATLIVLTAVCLVLVAVTGGAKVGRTRRERALATLAAPQRILARGLGYLADPPVAPEMRRSVTTGVPA